MGRLTISSGKITFYEPIYAKCSNKNTPKIQKQIDKNIPFYDMVGYKYEDMTIRKVEDIYNKLAKLEDVLEKYDIESAEDLNKFIHHKDGQIKKWKQDYENYSKLEKSISKEHQCCLDNWRACENELAELKQKAIVPKFQVGQTLFRIDFGSIVPFLVNEIYGYIKADKSVDINYFDYVGLIIKENDLFATREDAEQKLAVIKGKK